MATKIKRRQPDKITNPKDYGDPIASGIHYAIKPLDKIASEMEITWGCDRLPKLVSPELAAKFGAAKAKLDDAIENNDPQAVAKRATVMIKGYKALNKEAEKNYKPFKPSIWHHTTDKDFKFAVAQGNADAIKAIRTQPEMEGVAVYSLDEIGHLLENDTMALVNSIKDVFPDAQITEVRKAVNSVDDELPF
jgi:hypothetical protein